MTKPFHSPICVCLGAGITVVTPPHIGKGLVVAAVYKLFGVNKVSEYTLIVLVSQRHECKGQNQDFAVIQFLVLDTCM